MRSALILALGGVAIANPLGDAFNAVFHREEGHHKHEHGHHTREPGHHTREFGHHKSHRPFPTGTGGFHHKFPAPTKALKINYPLAPTVYITIGAEKRQATESPLPSFSVFDPKDPKAPGLPSGAPSPELPPSVPSQPGSEPELPTPPPSGGAPPFPFPTRSARLPRPTGGFPGGFPRPTGGMPGGPEMPPGLPPPTGGRPGAPGLPGLPSTLATRTRGARPTRIPVPTALPKPGDLGKGFWEQLKEWLGNGNQGGN